MPEGRGDQSADGSRDDLVTDAFGPGATLIDPTAVLQLAAVGRIDHEIADATRAPQTLCGLASDSSTVAGVVGRDAEGVEVAGDHPAALAAEGKTLVDVAHEIGCALVGPDDRLVGHQASGLLEPIDSEAKRDDPARVAALSSCAIHAARSGAQECDPGMIVDHREKVEGYCALFALRRAQGSHAEFGQPSSGQNRVGGIATQTIGLVAPHLVKEPGGSIAQEPATGRSVREWNRPADSVTPVSLHKPDARPALKP